MSDENTTEVVEDTPEDTTVEATAEVTPEDSEGQEDDGPLAKQAAKYRRQARELQAERDDLAGRLAAAQDTITGLYRAHAERLAADHGLKPEALWATVELDALLGDGGVDPARVKTAAATAAQQLGVRLTPALQIREGHPSPPVDAGRAKWDALFRPN